jgi:Abortive infection C-terminus
MNAVSGARSGAQARTFGGKLRHARREEADDLPMLYHKLAKILKLALDDHTEQVFKQILGSCQSVVESLGALRNKLSDAHSPGPKRARPQARHAELAVNLAGAMATFLVATWEARQTEWRSIDIAIIDKGKPKWGVENDTDASTPLDHG